MPNINYVAQGLDGEQIEAALTAIDGVVSQENNGKVLAIENGKIVAKSASEWTDTPVLEPLSVTENGDYTPGAGVDGFNAVHVAVPGATLTTKSITQNGTYNASQDDADGYSSVTVNVPGGATIEPLTVTQNGTYTPPSGVDGYAPVTVNVSGGGGSRLPAEYQEVEYLQCTEAQYSTINQTISNEQFIITVVSFGKASATSYYPTVVGRDSDPQMEMYLYNNKLTFYGSLRNCMSDQVTYNLNQILFFAARAAANFPQWCIGRYYTNGTGNTLLNGKIYAIQVSDTTVLNIGTITLNFVPCYRKSDNKAGFYELVNRDFYPSEGASDYIAGPDI